MEKDVSLVYMVAGLSSRFGGKIKAFAEVGLENESLIEYSLKQALPAGFNKIIFIVGLATEKAFRERFGDTYQGIPVKYALQKFDSTQRDKPWGTCDALCSAKNLIDSDFVVCNGDDLYGEEPFKNLFDHLRKNKECATIGYSLSSGLSSNGTVNRGIYTINGDNVSEIKEVIGISKDNFGNLGLKIDNLCSMNLFGLKKETIDLLYQKLEAFKKRNEGNRKIECYLPVELSDLIKENKIKMKVYSTQAKWIGITNPGDEEIVRLELMKLKS